MERHVINVLLNFIVVVGYLTIDIHMYLTRIRYHCKSIPFAIQFGWQDTIKMFYLPQSVKDYSVTTITLSYFGCKPAKWFILYPPICINSLPKFSIMKETNTKKSIFNWRMWIMYTSNGNNDYSKEVAIYLFRNKSQFFSLVFIKKNNVTYLSI